jgi:hypothetical protein
MIKRATPDYNPHRPNFFGAFRDIIVHLTNKGQLLLAILGAILIIAVLKMPATDISKLFNETLVMMESYHILGWVTSAVLTPVFIFFYSRRRVLHEKELEQLQKFINKEEH